MERVTVVVTGWVQGVGFRAWTRAQAVALGLTGSAVNRPDGRVEVIAEGPPDAVEVLLAALRSPAAPGRVDDVSTDRSEVRGSTGFDIG